MLVMVLVKGGGSVRVCLLGGVQCMPFATPPSSAAHPLQAIAANQAQQERQAAAAAAAAQEQPVAEAVDKGEGGPPAALRPPPGAYEPPEWAGPPEG
jgi:hypothetical protein